LAQGAHTLKVAARGAHNPYAQGNRVGVEAVQFSAADGAHSYPAGTGPTQSQRMIFGYVGRSDYRDAQGHAWRPATELVTRAGTGADSVEASWWHAPASSAIGNTSEPELYRYGVHGSEFWVNLTVGPGKYHLRLKFAATRGLDPRSNGFDILINGTRVVEKFAVAAAAGGSNRATDLEFDDLAPRNGIIEVRFKGSGETDGGKPVPGEAFVQSLELDSNQTASSPTPSTK